MAIENRKLPAGTRLVATYRKQAYVCTAEAGEDGKLAFVLEDGKRFKSPSSAGSAVMGGSACNGWRFWSVEGAEPATTTTDAADTPASGAKASTQPKAFKLIKRTPNQKGVLEGSMRCWCAACQKSFIAEGSLTPANCPEGHRADDPELTAAPTAEEAASE